MLLCTQIVRTLADQVRKREKTKRQLLQIWQQEWQLRAEVGVLPDEPKTTRQGTARSAADAAEDSGAAADSSGQHGDVAALAGGSRAGPSGATYERRRPVRAAATAATAAIAAGVFAEEDTPLPSGAAARATAVLGGALADTGRTRQGRTASALADQLHVDIPETDDSEQSPASSAVSPDSSDVVYMVVQSPNGRAANGFSNGRHRSANLGVHQRPNKRHKGQHGDAVGQTHVQQNGKSIRPQNGKHHNGFLNGLAHKQVAFRDHVSPVASRFATGAADGLASSSSPESKHWGSQGVRSPRLLRMLPNGVAPALEHVGGKHKLRSQVTEHKTSRSLGKHGGDHQPHRQAAAGPQQQTASPLLEDLAPADRRLTRHMSAGKPRAGQLQQPTSQQHQPHSQQKQAWQAKAELELPVDRRQTRQQGHVPQQPIGASSKQQHSHAVHGSAAGTVPIGTAASKGRTAAGQNREPVLTERQNSKLAESASVRKVSAASPLRPHRASRGISQHELLMLGVSPQTGSKPALHAERQLRPR